MTLIYHDAKARTRVPDIQGIIWDLDNTLYRLDAVQEDAFNLAVAQAVIATGVDLPLEQAWQMAGQSYAQYGQSSQVFIDRYGLNRQELHHRYHDLMSEKNIDISHEIRDLFARKNLRHVVLTHASRGWAERVLAHLDLSDWFPPSHILGYEDYDFLSKNRHSTGFDKALSVLGTAAAHTAVVEDTLKNLEIPHRLGMVTAYIRHGRPVSPPPPFLQISGDTLADVLGVIVRAA